MNCKDLSACRDTIEALPWHANGTLDDAERRRVDDHVADCASCARELETLQRMQDAIAARNVTADDTAAFSQLLQRINQRERQAHYWKIAAMLIAMLAIVLAVAIPAQRMSADYRAVTEPLAAEERVRLEVTLQDPANGDALVQLLQRYPADVIEAGGDGPLLLEFRLDDATTVADLERALLAEDQVRAVARIDE